MVPEIDRLLVSWGREVRPATRLLGAAIGLGVVSAAALTARGGTTGWRTAAAVGLALAMLGLLGRAVWWRWRSRDVRWALRRVVGAADREGAQRVERALGLWERSEREPASASPELARLHLQRQLARIDTVAVEAGARRRAGWLRAVAAGTAVVAAGLMVARGPFAILEGLDVLVARHDRAPLDLGYLDEVQVEVQPPDYLKERSRQRPLGGLVSAPYGSLIIVRGEPRRSGRRLVLTDGESEIPFVDDGAGRVAARWPLKSHVKLEVAARLGAVRVEQGDPVMIRSVADEAPQVSVEGAPATHKIVDLETLPLLYRATDDHGLRQVDLVMRSAGREERRVLARLDGDSRHDEGGYQLRGSDPFLAQAYLPVEVVIEARDNDPLTGPKWGKSPPILLLPPAIGEPEARRLEGLLAVRAALVDLLARASGKPPAKELRAAADEASEQVKRALTPPPGGLALPRRVSMFVAGQVGRAIESVTKTPTKGEPLAVLESAVLAVDRAALALAQKDAQTVAKRLSRLALDASDQMGKSRQGVQPPAVGRQRVEGTAQVLEPSGQALARLGVLGADLGSIVANDLRRLRRALKANDLLHAELVMLDLGLRLQKAEASFAGGAGSGEGGGQSDQGPSADDAASGEGEGQGGEGEEESFAAEQKALQELMRDHAGNLEDTQQSMRRAADGSLPEGFAEEARQHAQSARQAMRGLPGSDEAGGEEASQARSQVERMAQALERGDVREALEAARAADQMIDEAARAARRTPELDARRAAEQFEQGRERLSPDKKWVEDVAQKMQQALQGANLKETSEREGRLADRTRELGRRAQNEHGALPPEVRERLEQAEQAMREATRALAQGQGEQALDHQRRAQQLLDRSQGAEEESKPEKQDPGDRDGAHGQQPSRGNTPIPGASEHHGPGEFRKRVTEGLRQGQTPGLRDAIQRYAERLLK